PRTRPCSRSTTSSISPTRRRRRAPTPRSRSLGSAAAAHLRVELREHPGRVVAPDPHVEVVVPRHAGRVTGHRTVERLAEENGGGDERTRPRRACVATP